jgi:hypothetical protein
MNVEWQGQQRRHDASFVSNDHVGRQEIPHTTTLLRNTLEQLRVEHLATIETPTLIVQGERDPFGSRDEVAGYKLSLRDCKPWDARMRQHADAVTPSVSPTLHVPF